MVQKELNCPKSSPWEFQQPGKTDKIGHHTQTNFVTNYHTSNLFFKVPIHLSLKWFPLPLRGLHLSSFPIKMIFKPESQATSGSYSFFPWYLPCALEVYMVINVYLFSSVVDYRGLSQELRRVEGNYVSSPVVQTSPKPSLVKEVEFIPLLFTQIHNRDGLKLFN